MRKLFEAQRDDMQGMLRLDISSRRFPPDPEIPCAWTEAREAVAERLLRLLAGFADERVLEWDANHPAETFVVMPDQHNFVDSLTRGVVRVYGLDQDKPIYPCAVTALATDLFQWASACTVETLQQHHLIVHWPQLLVEGRPYPSLAGLMDAWVPFAMDRDASELRALLENQ